MLVYRQTGSDNQFTFVRGIVRTGFLVTPSAKFIEEALVLTLGEHKEFIQSFPPFFINMHQMLIKISLYMFDIQNEWKWPNIVSKLFVKQFSSDCGTIPIASGYRFSLFRLKIPNPDHYALGIGKVPI